MKKRATKLIVWTLIFIAAGTTAALQAQEAEQTRFRLGVYYEGVMLNDKNLTHFFGHSQRNLPGIEASVHTLYNVDVYAAYRIYRDETTTTVFATKDKFRLNMASLGLVYRPLVWNIHRTVRGRRSRNLFLFRKG